jgi:polyisoprenoid-binding protein YceI
MRATTILWALLATAAPLAAAEQELRLTSASTAVTFDVGATGHDVHGLVSLKSGEIRFDPATGAASGEIVLDPAAAVTGNASRDKTLRDDVFEVAKFPEIRFVPARIEGLLPAAGKGHITLHGTITLHGAEHPFALPADVTVAGDHVDADAKATIPYQEWGLHDPSVLFLRVADVVAVSIHASGELRPAALPERTGGR